MDIGSVFLILALLILVGLFVSKPLFERRAIQVSSLSDREDHDLSHLLAERDRILNALQEMDFDYNLGKIPEEDYPAQRAALVQRGAEVLRQLDEYTATGSMDEVDARLEAAIAARRAASAHPSTAQPVSSGEQEARSATSQVSPVPVAAADDDIEALIAARRRARQEKSAGFCPQCGNPLQKSDHFCPKCGAALA